MIIAGSVILMILLFALWQKWELTRFEVTDYTVKSEKIEKEHRAVVIADLHGFRYGRENERLLAQIKKCCPEVILIPGDLIVSKYSDTFETALELLQELGKIAPVYYSFGNHETRLRSPGKKNHPAFQEYIRKVKGTGTRILNNESVRISELEGIRLTGLELPLSFYEKGRIVPMEPEYLTKLLPRPEGKDYNILLAHNPAYAKEYAAWGAELTLCGHNHGGLVRIPGIGSLFSPQLTLFPKYDAGSFRIGGKEVIVSRGLGTHTFHIRIFNRAELLYLHFQPEKGNSL